MERFLRRSVASSQAGQSIALIALLLPVLLGFVGLSIDFGRLAVQRRKLQGYADAAALAGAQDLSVYYQQACTDASTSLQANNNPGTSTCSITSSSSTNLNDTITVTLSQAVPLDFMGVLGLASRTVTATGWATTWSVTGCSDTQTTVCAPYAAWRPDASSGCPDQFTVGMTVVFRDNGWSDDTGASNCAAWSVNSNDFKGFLRPTGGSIQVGNDTITTHGGNACGQEPAADVAAAAAAGDDIIIPVLDSGSGNGNTTIHVPGFITLSLNFTYPYPNQTQSVTMNGAPTGGSFALTYGSGVGHTTVGLSYPASASTVQSALGILPGVGSSNVTVTDQSGTGYGPYLISFGGSMNMSNLQAITAASSLTGGSSPSIAVAQSETDSSLSGTASLPSQYTCPATWYGVVTQEDTSASALAGVGSETAACTSTFYSCQIRLQP